MALVCSACGHLPGESLRPTTPPIASKSLKTVILDSRVSGNKQAAITLDEAKEALTAIRMAVINAAERKNAQSWDAGLTTLLGGSMATVGSVASKVGLMNTGFFLAFLGLTGEQFYKPANTIEVHLNADTQLLCIEDELSSVSEAERVLAESAADELGADEARKAVDSSLQAISTALLTYRRNLLGIRPGTPSRADLLGFLKRYQEDQDAKANQPASKGIDAEARRTAAAAKFIGLTTAMQACVKVGVPPTK